MAHIPEPEAENKLYDQPILILDAGMHTATIRRADVDAAGVYAVTCSLDSTVRVWSVKDGKLLLTIRLPMGPDGVGPVRSVAISPDGSLIAADSRQVLRQNVHGYIIDVRGQIYLLDRDTGTMVRRVALPTRVQYLTFSPNGRYLAATLDGNQGLRVYDRMADWVEIFRDTDYSSHCSAFAPDGRLATVGVDEVRIYDPQFRHPPRVKSVYNPDFYWDIAFSSDNRLAINTEYRVRLFDCNRLEYAWWHLPHLGGLPEVHFDGLKTVAWSKDGATLFAGEQQNSQEMKRELKCRVFSWDKPSGDLYGSERGMGGTPKEFPASRETIMSLKPLQNGSLLVASVDPYLGVIDEDGGERWAIWPPIAVFRGQASTLGVSADGRIIDFGYEKCGGGRARFDLTTLALRLGPAEDGQTARPEQATLPINGWENQGVGPKLDGKQLPLQFGEWSRSLAIHPDGRRFALGSTWFLRVFDRAGEELWRRTSPEAVWAVNITGDGRLVLAAYGDGTIRWHRMDDGCELLAFFPLADRKNWVAWTPEGFYAATPGAYGTLRWHVNRGSDQAAEAIPVDEIPLLRRPQALPLVLQEMETARALGVNDLQNAARAVQLRTSSLVRPGARMHVLAIGVSDFGEQARHLRLRYADQDAWDVASALVNTQGSLYADISLHLLRNDEVTRSGIFRAFEAISEQMAKAEHGRDVAVVMFSGHGAMVDAGFYLFTYGVDARTPVDIKATALPMNEFREELHKLGKYGRVLVLLDACHSGAATIDGTPLMMNADLMRAALATTNVTVLTSSSAGETSFEDERWQNGAFTEAFLEALSDADFDRNGLISVTDLTSYLTSQVPRLTDNKQKPGIEVRFQSDLFVAGL